MNCAKTVRIAIEGRVQGVGFRAWTQRQARALGIDGWVRNRRDGTLEALFSGPEGALDEMVARCRKGPTWAKVERIIELHDGALGNTSPPLSGGQFSIRETL